MPENTPDYILKQLDSFFKELQTSTDNVLKEVSSALDYLNPKSPTITPKTNNILNPKQPTTNPNNSNQEKLVNHSPNDSTRLQSVYDKAFENFKIVYNASRLSPEILNNPKESKNTITDEKQLKLEFNKRIQNLIQESNRLYIDPTLSELNGKHLRVAFIASFDRQDLINPQKFNSIIGDQSSTQALSASQKQKFNYSKPQNSTSTPLDNNSNPPLSDSQNYKKAPKAECPDIFSFFGQHLKTGTNFLTSVTSLFDSCINPRKTPDFKYNETDQIPGPSPELTKQNRGLLKGR